MNNFKNNNLYNDDINILLDTYYLELNYCIKKLKILEKHKPFFFEFNRLKDYKKEKESIENKIKEYEIKIADIINN